MTAFLSIAVVFAVIGTNQGIFGNFSYQTAIGAGWLLLAMINVSMHVAVQYYTRSNCTFPPFLLISPLRTICAMTETLKTDSLASVHHCRRRNTAVLGLQLLCRRCCAQSSTLDASIAAHFFSTRHSWRRQPFCYRSACKQQPRVRCGWTRLRQRRTRFNGSKDAYRWRTGKHAEPQSIRL